MITASPFDPPPPTLLFHHSLILIIRALFFLIGPWCFFVLFFWPFILFSSKSSLFFKGVPPPCPLNPIISSLYSFAVVNCVFVRAEVSELHTDLPGPFSGSLFFIMFRFNIHSLRWVEGIKPCVGWDYLLFFLLVCLFCQNVKMYSLKFLKNSLSILALINCCCWQFGWWKSNLLLCICNVSVCELKTNS